MKRSPAYSRELDLLLVIYLSVILLSILYPASFFSWDNARAILRNLAVDGTLAVGMMALMIAGVFDLSVGSTMSLAGVLAGWLMVRQGWPWVPAVVAGLAAAAAGGVVNGLLVAWARVNALITTLGTMGVLAGIALLIGGPGIANLPQGFTAIGQTDVLGLQLPVWFMILLAAAAHYLLRNSRPFRQLYYVGANAKAARLSGIAVEKIQVLGFTLMGLISGAAGILFAARVGTAVSTAGAGAELRVVTAVILGGASLQGGKGSIPGALIGVLFIALVSNALIIIRLSSEWQGIVVGIILVLAVALDSFQSRAR
ncbi:MAG: ABC transporter permease [Planctomycetes bacterium]|nr:ABC transporter permease [Planctomycetota bacterium]